MAASASRVSPKMCDAIMNFAREDINRVIFALKLGIALVLVSVLVLVKTSYHVFDTENIVWAILTVVMMFEYNVGDTIIRGSIRTLGTLFAGVSSVAIAEIALRTGRVAEPIIIGISIFLIGAFFAFIKLMPTFKPYEYGLRVNIFTFSLLIVSGYQTGSPLKTSIERVIAILVGVIIAGAVNAFIFPVWSGVELHKKLVTSFGSVADMLETCVDKYLADGSEPLDLEGFKKTLVDEFPNEPAYKNCRSTLNSSTDFDNMAILAKWEPPHGRFRKCSYPWDEYVRVGAILRYCAYEVMALHGVLHSSIQAPYVLKCQFQQDIKEATKHAIDLIKCLANEISEMRQTSKSSALKGSVQTAKKRLQTVLDTCSYLFASRSIASSSTSFPKPSSVPPSVTEVEMQSIDPVTAIDIPESEIQTSESTAAFSVATFLLLLIEFMTRLDLLVDAVDALSNEANFEKRESTNN